MIDFKRQTVESIEAAFQKQALAQLAPKPEGSVLEDHDRALQQETAQRIIEMSMDADDYDAWLDALSREFGLDAPKPEGSI
jgi:hypothetical protein